MSNIFKVNDYCVYRMHGVAKITEIKSFFFEETEQKCLVLYFEKEKMILTVPNKFKENGDLRKLMSSEEMKKAFDILKSGVKKLKGMWSRRAKEYKDKINSGNVFKTAEVLRDLIRDVDEEKRSFSERVIYDTAVYRLASEYSAIKKISYEEAEKYILNIAKEKIKSDEEVFQEEEKMA